MSPPEHPAEKTPISGVEDTVCAGDAPGGTDGSLAGTFAGPSPAGSATPSGLERTEAGPSVGEEDTLAGGSDPAPRSAGSPADGPRRGDRLGRYEVLEPLGAGGMGVVFSGFDPELQRPVALKLLSTRALQGDSSSDARSRLLREAQAMARLAHPNVISVYDVGMWNDQVYIAMERVDGLTLGAWLREQKRAPREILEIFTQAARGLAAAHQAGLVHRDFKPDNVLVGRDGRVRVMDFGLARQPGTADPAPGPEGLAAPVAGTASSVLEAHLTRTGALLGTPAYMSPEQFDGRPTDARTDQFSFAVALYEAFHGKRPFEGRSFEALSAAVREGPRPSCPITASTPPFLCCVFDRALAAAPEARFPSMQTLLDTLESGRRARQRRIWIAVGAGVALLIAFGALFAWQRVAESRREKDRVARAARRDRLEEQQRLARMQKRFAALRERRAALLAEVGRTSDQDKREELLCQAAGLEDVIAQPGEQPSAKVIQATIRRCFPMVKKCYDSILAAAPQAQGTIKVRFETDEKGTMTRVTFPEDQIRIPALLDCMHEKMMKWSFPTGGEGGKLRVTMPFRFKHK